MALLKKDLGSIILMKEKSIKQGSVIFGIRSISGLNERLQAQLTNMVEEE